MKKLVVFFDGTWNRPDKCGTDGRPCPTNIVKLFEATCQEDRAKNPQVAHYVQGVGTHRFERWRGGGFGYGISDDIKEGYSFLVSNYQDGDEIYIFGFSRGAYAARSLAGMIYNVGLLRRERLHLINEAFRGYRNRSKDWRPDGKKALKFRKLNNFILRPEQPKNSQEPPKISPDPPKIKFLGVFDTVGALGAPYGIIFGWIVGKLFNCRFHDTKLSEIIQSAYHAVSIDERRLPFMYTPMTPSSGLDESKIEEKWFPGVHSNVGGGYSDAGLSDIALGWMASKAIQNGLSLKFNSRKIQAPDCMPDVMARPDNSQSLGYRILTVLTVKLPGYIWLVPPRYKAAWKNIRWSGDYIRPIPDKGYVGPFIGNLPARPVHLYEGCLHSSVLKKITRCWNEYQPPNVC